MNSLLFRVAGGALGAVVVLTPARAQNELDALRYSQLQYTGTSRTQALGGAGSSLGADLGSFVQNPTNLGNYRRSEFSVTPGLLLNSSESTAGLGTTPGNVSVGDDRNGFNFANFGVAITTRKDDESSDWRGGSIGINFSRLNTFSARRTYDVALTSDSNSVQEFMVEYFEHQRGRNIGSVLQSAKDNVIEDFADLAYNGYLLNFGKNQQGQDTYFTPDWRGGGQQHETTTIRGAQNQIDIGYGASFRDKLYLGGSLGILTLRYKQTRTLTETTTNPNADLRSLELTDGYEVNGGGINLRVGMVYRPVDAIRVGLAIQTPSWFSELKEQDDQILLRTAFNRRFPDSTGVINPDPTSIAANTYQYAMTTPFRATGGLTLIGGKIGLVTADVDYVNYGSARLHNANNEPDTFSETNNVIRNSFRSTVNYRVGGELRLAGIFRLRAGYALYGSPFTDTGRKGERTVISAGAGLRLEKFYLDLGWSRTEYEQEYSPYTLSKGNEPVVTTRYTLMNPTITLGFILQ